MNRICTGTPPALKATISDLTPNPGGIDIFLEHSTFIQFLMNVRFKGGISILAKAALGRQLKSTTLRQHEQQVSRPQSLVEQGTPQKAICENQSTI